MFGALYVRNKSHVFDTNMTRNSWNSILLMITQPCVTFREEKKERQAHDGSNFRNYPVMQVISTVGWRVDWYVPLKFELFYEVGIHDNKFNHHLTLENALHGATRNDWSNRSSIRFVNVMIGAKLLLSLSKAKWSVGLLFSSQEICLSNVFRYTCTHGSNK